MYKLLRTVCNASCHEMNSEYIEKRHEIRHRLLLWLNSQILINSILGFGATSTKKQRKPGGDKPAKETRKSTNTRRGSRQNTTAHQSHPYVSTHHEVLNRCSSAAAFHMLQVAACNAERGCGAAALLKVIVSSSLDFFDGNFVIV